MPYGIKCKADVLPPLRCKDNNKNRTDQISVQFFTRNTRHGGGVLRLGAQRFLTPLCFPELTHVLISNNCYYQLSGTAVVAEFAEVDALPSAEVQTAIGDGNGDADTAKC